MAQYKKAFEPSFEAVDRQLVSVEEALSRDRLYTDKKTSSRPYSKEQLIKRLNDVERDITELETVLAKRKQREPEADLTRLGLRLRIQNYAFTLLQAVKGHKSRRLEEF
ncbi:MAG: hypothetical protein M3251_03285 [Thermoproteota archaeon]|nr:hypothetical protein [Thermoproteota archaeon]MDQ3888276.1 hypothetical protein [Thermoproteota archaeon]